MSKDSNKLDDLEAVRILTDTLNGFSDKEQERIIRWTREKLGLPHSEQSDTKSKLTDMGKDSFHQTPPHQGRQGSKDIKSFFSEKKPSKDTHFAATVAYYYKFEAPEPERMDNISSEDLLEACRKVGRSRLNNPLATLNNAHRDGLLDRSGEKGRFIINTVGENLVAMALPDGTPDKIVRKKISKKAHKKESKKQRKEKKSKR